MKTAIFSLRSAWPGVWFSICLLMLPFTSPVLAHTSHSHQHEQVAEEQVYTCSMHPQVRSTNPDDRCPICGMALVAVSGGSHNDEDEFVRIEFSGRALALLNVQTTPVVRGIGQRHVEVSGQLEFAEDLLHTISAWSGGRIERLLVNYSGEQVSAGEPLVELYSPELLVAQQELLQALRYAQSDGPQFIQDSSQLTLQASRRRLHLLGLTEQQIDHLIEQGQASDRITIVAPASGVVVSREARQGDYVNPGDMLLALVDTSRLWAVLEVYERDADVVALDEEVEIHLPALRRHVTGQVISVAPQLDPQTRTRQVRVVIDNPDGALAAGMFARSRLAVEHEESLLIPNTAPLLTGQRAVVYVQSEPGHFEAREITLGAKLGTQYAVADGLQAGELVVSRGAFRIDSELQLRGRPSMMSPQGGGGAGHEHGGHTSEQTADHAMGHAVDSDSLEDQHALQDVFAAYHHLWFALQDDDLAGWQQAADVFYDAVSAVDWPHTMASVEVALSRGSGHSHHVQDIAQARDYFYDQSQALIELARAGLHQGGLYLMYCPMARDDQGAYWLQQDDTLLNPYFGAQMLRCGSVRGQLGSHEGGGPSHD